MEDTLARLDELKIQYTLDRHPAVYTIEELDALDLPRKDCICKNLFLRNAKGDAHYLVVLPGHKQADLQVLREQLEIGLEGVDKTKVVIGYEPIWSIGPGKTPAGRDYIQKIARFVKEVTGGCDVVYGGGLKVDNAEMLASIPEIDGGLIALTRFQGEIGFYPEEYLEIIRTYLGK